MLVMIPLLASPVAAQVSFTVDVYTANTMLGPTVGLNGPPQGAYVVTDDSSGSISFRCNYTMSDTTISSNSRHYVELNVQKQRPSVGPVLGTNTGNVYLSAGQSISGTLVINDTYNPSVLTLWNVWVYAECEDIPTGRMAWNTWYWSVTVP
jgi:hypothetical protein